MAESEKSGKKRQRMGINSEVITSLQNPKVKNVVKLRERRHRDLQGLMLIEGIRELTLALDNRINLESIFYCEKYFHNQNELPLIKHAKEDGITLIEVDKRVFQKIAYKEHPDGLLAVAHQPKLPIKNLVLTKSPLLVVVVAIEKPGNLGAILRSADAAGVDGVIVCDQCTDIYNPNVVRSSIGTIFSMQVATGSSREVIYWLKEKGILTVAASPGATNEYTDIDFRTPVAIVLGSEKLGLSDEWLNIVDKQACIPMHGQADSLNVAVSTTVFLYEAIRQRRSG